jgi:hypothetical protein
MVRIESFKAGKSLSISTSKKQIKIAMQPELINLHEIKAYNNHRYFKLMQGDVTQIDFPVDMLCLSAYKGDYEPVPGTTIGALYKNLGINLMDLAKKPKLDLRKSEETFITDRTNHKLIERILCLEMVGASHRDLDTTFNALLSSLYKAELHRIHTRSVVMVLFGTGNQKLEAEAVMKVLIKKIEYLLQTSHRTEEVILVEYNPDKAKKLSIAMDRILQRTPVLFQKESIMGAVISNIQKLYRTNVLLSREKAISEIVEEIGRTDKIEATKLSMLCRNMCEFMMGELYPRVKGGNLAAKITQVFNQNDELWAGNFFHTLKAFGNSHSHDIPRRKTLPHIDQSDLIIVLFCIEKVLLHYLNRKKAGRISYHGHHTRHHS